MTCIRNATLVSFLAVATAAVTAHAADKDKPAEAAPAVTVDDKTLRKLSMGVGEEVGDFTVTKQEPGNGSAATKATLYTVETRGGRRYKCEIHEDSKLSRIASFGMKSGGSSAMCTEFGAAAAAKGARGKPAATAAASSKPAADRAAPATAVTVDDRTARKLSMGVGEEVGDFTVTGQEPGNGSAAMKATIYTVETRGGRRYKCEVFEDSKLSRIASFGMKSGGSSAMCTEFGAAASAGKRKADTAAGSAGKGGSRGAVPASTVTVDDNTARKLSMGIGEEIGDFAVTQQEAGSGSAAMKATVYTVETGDGRRYKCEIHEDSKFMRVASFGMKSGGSSAVCTDFTPGSKTKGKVAQASCNDLLRAAGKCS